jgi:plastocyanin
MIQPKLLFICASLLTVVLAAHGQTKQTTATAKASPKAAAVANGFKSDAPVSGSVVFRGVAPKAKTIAMDSEPVCVAKHTGPVTAETVVVNPNGTLKNVFIYVKAGLEGKSFPALQEPVTLTQDGCVYLPHVFGIMANQELRVVNGDATTHNVHALAETNEAFNVGQRAGAPPITRTFPKPEITVPIVCNQHPWMKAVAHVVSNPYYAVTGNDGTFELKGLPPGKYTIEAIHEKYGASIRQVTVEAGKNATLTFTFSATQSYVPPSLATVPAVLIP